QGAPVRCGPRRPVSSRAWEPACNSTVRPIASAASTSTTRTTHPAAGTSSPPARTSARRSIPSEPARRSSVPGSSSHSQRLQGSVTGAASTTRWLSLPAHGVKVIATLGNQWIDCDGPAGGAGPYKTDAWYSGGYTQPDPAG